MTTLFEESLQHRRGDGAAAVEQGRTRAPGIGAVVAVARRILGWIALRRTQTELRSLSDRQLDDLGLTREQVEDPHTWPRHRIGRGHF